MKFYVDHKTSAQETQITPGNIVLMRQPKQNKLSTPYNPKPFVVEEKKGSMVTVRNGSQTITRNSSQFKVVPKHLMNGQNESGRKGVSDTPVVQPKPAEAKENIPLRRSQRQIRPPVRFSDYVRTLYLK